MDVSVIILNYNTWDLLKDCLSSLYQFTTGIDYEVIVVDNGSADASLQSIPSEFPDVKIIRNEQNVGFSRGNNIGAINASGLYLLFLNTDVIFKENCIKSLAEFLRNHTEIGAVGPKLLNIDGSFQLSCGSLPNLFVETWDKIRYYFYRKGGNPVRRLYDRLYRKVKKVGWITGACMMVRSDAYRLLGGFDEKIFMYFEDKDLCHRLRKQGWETAFLPETSILHLLGGTSRKSDIQNIKRFYRDSQQYYYRKNLNKLHQMGLRIYLMLAGKV